MAFVILWELRVRAGREAQFERRYGADGDWAALFRRGEGYVGTTEAYAALDLECTALTEDERCLGEFEPL